MKKNNDEPAWEGQLIQDAAWIGGYNFRILFQNGVCKIVNVSAYLEKHRKLFAPLLEHPARAAVFQFDLIELYWDDKMGIEAQTLYKMGENVMKKTAEKGELKYLYFAYGSNLNREQMLLRCPDAQPLTTAVLEDYRLVERRYADIEEAKDECVHGAIYGLSQNDLDNLDHYEGYPECYTRKKVSVRFSFGGTGSALVYVMTEVCRDCRDGEPYSRAYRQICSAGAQEWNVPDAFVLKEK